jgi:DNA-binding NtrC family response regulator
MAWLPIHESSPQRLRGAHPVLNGLGRGRPSGRPFCSLASLISFLNCPISNVLEASSPGDARTLLKDGSRRIDIVLAEVKSGEASGFALASWVRTHLPNTQVVLAGTIATAAEKAGDICQEGPALSKPYDHRLVLDHIQRLLAARDRNDRT